jgi:hypothetical protein
MIGAKAPFIKEKFCDTVYLRYFKSVSAKADLLFLVLTDLKSFQSLAPPVKESLQFLIPTQLQSLGHMGSLAQQ